MKLHNISSVYNPLVNKKVLTVIVALLVVGILTSFTSLVRSEEGGSGLQVVPTRHEIVVQPGEARTIEFSIKNVTQSNIIARAVINDFESDNDTGQPVLRAEDAEPLPTSIKPFVKGFEDVPLGSGETARVEVTIDLPSDVAPGAYFSALRYVAVPENASANEEGRQVALTASVAPLVLVEVPGDIVESVSFEALKAERGEKSGFLFTEFPDTVALTVKNNGNSFARPFGKTVIFRGDTEVLSYEVNNTDPKGNVLPNSTRTFRDEVESSNVIGRYRVVSSIAYVEGGELLNKETVFYVIPYWAWAVILLILVGLIILVVKTKGSSKKSKNKKSKSKKRR
jgi:hypothetical protein